ncbi:MAG: hypothetical protein H0V95_06895, partial [Actinobacteria bacterium]|nr:hypothetical protein [Actinomycetota bacterium]
MRKTSLGVVVLAAVTLVAAACQPAPPPPPPPPHFDVLMVGDSIGFGVGCGVLGHEGDQQDVQCPDRDFSAVNAYAGACSISQGWLQLYNRQATNTGNCYDFPVRWQNHVNAWTPNLVV